MYIYKPKMASFSKKLKKKSKEKIKIKTPDR